MNTTSNDWTSDLFKLIWLTTFFAVSSRNEKEAWAKCHALMAESTEMEWTHEEIQWDTVYQIWRGLSNKIGELIDHLLESLGLTHDEVVVPFLKAVYCR